MATGDYKITFTDPAKDAGGYYITVQEGNVNTVDTSLILVGRNYPSYGQIIAQDLVHLLENFSSSSPPNNPIEGQLWFDTTDVNAKKLKINDGTAQAATWYPVGGVHQQASEPINTQIGDIWVDTSNNQLKIFNGGDFTLIGPNYSNALKSGSYATTATDILGQLHNIVINYVNGNAVEIISQDAFTPLQIIDGFNTIKSGSNITGKNLGTLVSPSYAQYNGVASQAAALQQTVPTLQTVSANNFVRNDINQKISGILNVGNDGGITIGLDPTIIIQRDDQYRGTFLNTYNGGEFRFQIVKDNIKNSILTIKGDSKRVGVNTASPTADLDVNGNVSLSGNLYSTGSAYVSHNLYVSNAYVASTLTCKYEQILVGPLTIGDQNTTSPTAMIPYATSTYDIGSPTKRWRNIYGNTFVGYLAGTATIATKLIGATTFYLSGDVGSAGLQWDGTPSANKSFITTLTAEAIFSKASTSTTALTDSVMIYRPQALPDSGLLGNGQLFKQTKADFLKDLYATALFTGAITAFAGTAQQVPAGWLKCDGSSYNATDYPALYAVIGQTYGGAGSTFNLPDLSSQLGAAPTSPNYLDYYIKT
jgi:hypothetical protein